MAPSHHCSALFRPFSNLRRAIFIERPNRFVVLCRLDDGREDQGQLCQAYLPNPGRLRELLLPQAQLVLMEKSPTLTSKMPFVAVGVERKGESGRHMIMLHTHQTNAVAKMLIERGRVPGLLGAKVVRAEHRVGRSRFDFLLERRGKPLLLEVKSCTLVHGRVAMFPDAVTLRGARHVRELAELSQLGRRTAVLFVVSWPEARVFAPDYHTDLGFAQALLESKEHVEIIALAVGWDQDLTLSDSIHSCAIPWSFVEREAQDRGSYLIILQLSSPMSFTTGVLGQVEYRSGYYIYVGSAMKALTQRIERHRRRRKRFHWHIDHLRERAEFLEALPLRSSQRLECDLAAAVRAKADWTVAGFGATDCGCGGHLFGFHEDPRQSRAFQDMLLRFRLNRLERFCGD